MYGCNVTGEEVTKQITNKGILFSGASSDSLNGASKLSILSNGKPGFNKFLTYITKNH